MSRENPKEIGIKEIILKGLGMEEKAAGLKGQDN
jgi:hypothetical protein